MTNPYTEDYFERGKASGLSNYVNYRWLRDQTCFCAVQMMKYLGAPPGRASVLDWGCAKGFYVKALRMIGYEAFGFDISEYAITHCHPDVKNYVFTALDASKQYDWVICKDVLEHIGKYLDGHIETIIRIMRKGALIIVPLAENQTADGIGLGGRFMAPQDNEDKTHVNCWGMQKWLNFIQSVIDRNNFDCIVQGGFRCPGVKEACDPYPNSVAFITIKKFTS